MINTKSKILISLFWKFLERGGNQGISFAIQIILARLLSPADFGILAIVVIIVNILNVFVQSGFGTALIQRKVVDEIDYNSVFIVSFLISVSLYIILYFSAPIIASFYSNVSLKWYIRVLGLVLVFGSLNNVQQSYLMKKLEFKSIFLFGTFASLISGSIGIYFAFKGFGVWSLVVQQLLTSFISTVLMLIFIEWKPKIMFSFVRVKALFSFGWKMLVSSLIDLAYNNVQGLIIGYNYPASTLGFYSKGKQFPQFIVANVTGAINSVMLPGFSIYQDNIQNLKKVVRISIRISSYLLFPVMMLLIVIANPLIEFLLTDKWLEAVPYMRIFAITFIFWPIHSANLTAINAIGRSDIFLKLEIMKKLIGISILLISLSYGPLGIAYGMFLVSFISTFINYFPNKNLICYTFSEQLLDIVPSLLISIISASISYLLLPMLNYSNLLIIFLVSICFVIIYLMLSLLTKNNAMKYIYTTVKQFIKGEKNE